MTGSYKEMTHTSLYVRFPIEGRAGESFLAWTTTPWTLPANVALAVHPDLDYARVRVRAFDPARNAGTGMSPSFTIAAAPLGVPDARASFSLSRPLPNPSRGSTMLTFSLPAAANARLEVLDLGGRRLWARDQWFTAGQHSVVWSGLDAGGGRIGAGLYFVRLVAPWGTRTERLALIR